MKISTVIIAVVVGLVAAFAGYTYLNQPRPMSDRLGGGADELAHGNFGKAADEVGDRTNGDKLSTDVKDATQPPANQ